MTLRYRAPLSLILSASLAAGSLGSSCPAAVAQVLLPGPAASAPSPSLLPVPMGADWNAGFAAFAQWLREPAALRLTAAIDPHLADIKALEDGPWALVPMIRRLERTLGPEGARAAVLDKLARLPRLAPAEQAGVVKELSAARRQSSRVAAAFLVRSALEIRAGRGHPEETPLLAGRAWAFRLYGEDAEKAVGEIHQAIAEERMTAIRKKARALLEERFPGRGDPTFLETPAAVQADPMLALGRAQEARPEGSSRTNAYAWFSRAAVLGHPAGSGSMLRALGRLTPAEVEPAERAAAWHLAHLASRAVPAPKADAPAPKKKSDLIPRIVTAAFLVPGLVGLIHAGGPAFSALVVVIAGLGNLEYGAMLQAGKRPVQRVLGVVSGAALALAPALGVPAAPVLASAAALVTLRELFRKDHSFERAALTLFGAVLLGFLPAHLIGLRALSPFGERLAFWVFASAWVSDTLGYVVGKPFGKHKMGGVSPNKSWEGTLAGFAGSLGVAAAFWALSPGLMSLPAALALGALLNVSGQASGFASSMIKRAVGVKDSGKLLPGHGGVVDRFDSLILSAAVAYYFIVLLSGHS